MIMVLVQTCSKCLKQNLETKKEINHFPIMEEDKDLNLGLQDIPAKATVWIRRNSSVNGRGCTVRSAETLVVITIPVLGRAWSVRSSNWPHTHRVNSYFLGKHLRFPASKELPFNPWKNLPYSQWWMVSSERHSRIHIFSISEEDYYEVQKKQIA